MAVIPGGGSGGGGGTPGGGGGVRKMQDGGNTSDTFTSNIESTANTQLINEASTISGGNAATKMVGWNAVPAGFEPLPRTVGGRKLAYQLSDFSGGLNTRTSPRDIALNETPECDDVFFGRKGLITVLGDANSTDRGTNWTLTSSAASGYGAFVFNSAYSLTSPPVNGNYEILARCGSTAGDIITFWDGYNSTHADFKLDLGTSSSFLYDCCPVMYAQGNAVYACDANFMSFSNIPKAMVLVHRPDINNGTVPIKKWVRGTPLLNSPTISTDGSIAGGIHDLIGQGIGATGESPTEDGGVSVRIVESGDTTEFPASVGGWGLADTSETFTFYVSWLFDGINETALSTLPTIETMSGASAECKIYINHTANAPVGGDPRINGMRVYYSKLSENDAKKYWLAEASWEEGVKRSTDAAYIPWLGTNPYYTNTFKIDNPPDLLEYVDLNGYFEDEVYDTAGNTSDIAPFTVKYKTATIGADGRVYIANVSFNASIDNQRQPISQDTMMFSMPGRPGCFPKFNTYESPSTEGGAIFALESFGDKILQFRKNSVSVVNVSRPQFYVEDVFNNVGVANPCQVCRIPSGVAWINSEGCYLYDGQSVTSLSHGKLNGMGTYPLVGDDIDIAITDESIVSGYERDRAGDASVTQTVSVLGDAADSPSIGYDSKSKCLIIFNHIGADSTADGGYVYDLMTQSWASSNAIWYNAPGHKASNFVTLKGRLSYWAVQGSTEANKPLYNYNAVPSADHIVKYVTKDIDFGAPSVRKKIYKVIVNYYAGGNTSLDVTYGVNGDLHLQNQMSSNTGGNLSNVGLYPQRTEFTPFSSSAGWDSTNNIYSFQLMFYGTAASTFKIEDITIIYRMKRVK